MPDQVESPDTSNSGAPTKMPPPMYATLSAGSQQPEPLRADSDEEAMATIRKRVRAGQVGMISLYKMIAAEIYEPSSVTVSPAETQAGKLGGAR